MKHLPEIHALWLRRQANRPLRGKRRYLRDVLLNEPALLTNRLLKVCIVPDEEVPLDIEKEYKETPFFDEETYDKLHYYPFFFGANDWHVETGDLILSFLAIGRPIVERIECEGILCVQEVRRSGLVPVKVVKQPLGLRFPISDRQLLSKLVLVAVNNNKLDVDSQLISIDYFTKRLFGSPR